MHTLLRVAAAIKIILRVLLGERFARANEFNESNDIGHLESGLQGNTRNYLIAILVIIIHVQFFIITIIMSSKGTY